MNSTAVRFLETFNRLEHPAVQAWQRLPGDRPFPERVEVLKMNSKSSVYRLVFDTPERGDVIAKRCPTATGLVERLVYQEILARGPEPALRCLGFTFEHELDLCWLFIEDAGSGDYSPTCVDHRELAGRSLALMQRLGRLAEARNWLPQRGSAYYRDRRDTAREALVQQLRKLELSEAESILFYELVAQFDLMETRWDELEYFCARQPRTLVHGNFVAKNLRVRQGPGALALLAFDWEKAGWGVAAADLTQYADSSASPDLEAYCTVMREDFPQLNRHDVQRLADYGRLFRVLDKVCGVTSEMTKEPGEFQIQPLRTFEMCRLELTAALQVLAWNFSD